MKLRALVAEFIATFALIFVGMMAIGVAFIGRNPAGLIAVALAYGFTIAVMASATAAISGGHINPAVTFAMLVTRRIGLAAGLGYVIAQLAGALAGAAAAQRLLPESTLENVYFAVPSPGSGLGPNQVFAIEAILTFLLVFVIFGTAVDRRAVKMGALFIGMTVTLDILAAGPLTGAAMNPAVWFGPALVSGETSNAWVYIFGPLVGAAAAALVYVFLMDEKPTLAPDAEVRTVSEETALD